ncbi:uncharacterized protein LOC108673776 [Hyalella azteca]|uniref:Uncharacterized protein LOC108673776 n=1 Tax=Hyalella azteca TaxID=294128 RepID=A0A8B7NTV0_HYAAZ|nr:uncharacterized protein LOC108673776 [Hyalella azteca]
MSDLEIHTKKGSNPFATFFHELSDNHQLHKSLLSTSIPSKCNDGPTILLKTLFVMFRDLQTQHKEARISLQNKQTKLNNLVSELCPECSGKTRLIMEKDKDSSLQISCGTVATSLSSEQQSDLSTSCSSTILGEKTKQNVCSSTKENQLEGGVKHPSCNASLTALKRLPKFKGGKIFETIYAPETQDIDIVESIISDNGGHIAETMDAIDVAVSDPCSEDSSDIFEESSEDVDGLSQYTIVPAKTSPVLGKFSSSRNSPTFISSSSSNGFENNLKSLPCAGGCIINDRKNELLSVSPGQNSCCTLSPRRGMDISGSPSLLQLLPCKRNIIPREAMNNKTAAEIIYSSPKSKVATTAGNREIIPGDILATENESLFESRPAIEREKTQPASVESVNYDQQTSLNSSDTDSCIKSKNCSSKRSLFQASFEELGSQNLCSKENVSENNSICDQISQITDLDAGASENEGQLINSVLNSSSELSFVSYDSSKSKEEAKRSDDVIRNQIETSKQEQNVIHKKMCVRKASNCSVIKRSRLTRAYSSNCNWKKPLNSVEASIKKNCIQTKLTKESFIVSKVRGNAEEDDIQILEAKARSLETKTVDDRKRVQQQHPALRALTCHRLLPPQGASAPAGDVAHSSTKRTSDALAEGAEFAKKFKSSSHQEKKLSNSGQELPSSCSLLTESQSLEYLQLPSQHQITVENSPAEGSVAGTGEVQLETQTNSSGKKFLSAGASISKPGPGHSSSGSRPCNVLLQKECRVVSSSATNNEASLLPRETAGKTRTTGRLSSRLSVVT